MACKVISVYCDISNLVDCEINYRDCFNVAQPTITFSPGATILLNGAPYVCAEEGTINNLNGNVISATTISDCDPFSPTPEPTETPTPTPTPTPTLTPEPYDIYLFEDCCDETNKFRIENVPGSLNEGQVFDINVVGFTGCATVISYSVIGPTYDGSIGSLTEQDDCSTCITCPTPTASSTPTQTPTQTPTPTPSPTPSSTPTQTPTPTPSPTPSSTPTQTPTPTPTPTPIICYSGVSTEVDWKHFDCCGDLIYGSGIGVDVCVNPTLPYVNIVISSSVCSNTCLSAAILVNCLDETVFYAIVDKDIAFVGGVYSYNGGCYRFVQFGGPGGPDLGTPDYGDCEACLIGPTSTPPPSPTTTPIPPTTPTPTPTQICDSSVFCLNTTLPTLSGYSGTYSSTSLFQNGRLYYSGNGITYGVIYYTGDRWCLSNTLGGSCLLEGAYPCYSICPDISANLFASGICPTPTPTPINCDDFDFTAYFDCNITPTPTATPTATPAATPTATPTPTPTPCNVGVNFSICRSEGITPTPTATPTPTPEIKCLTQNQRTFVMLDNSFNCVSVKVLIDCNGDTIYYVSDDLIYEEVPVTSGTTISANINGQNVCATYVRDETNISSDSIVSEIYEILIGCGDCEISPTPTQTPTATPTQTPTSTPTPTPTPTSRGPIGLFPVYTSVNICGSQYSFVNDTASNVKCYWENGVSPFGGAAYYYYILDGIAIGTQLYTTPTASIPLTTTLKVVYAPSQVVQIVNGIITGITNFSSLPPCSTSVPCPTPPPTPPPPIYYSFSACCDGSTFNLELGDLTPSIGDTYYFTSGNGVNSFSGCASVIASNSGYVLKTVNTAQSYETCDECTADHPCCECVRIIFTGTSSESSYNVSFTDCDGNTQSETIGAFSEAFCVSANTEIDSANRSFLYDGCCECGDEVPCEKWGVYANTAGRINFTYTACDGGLSGVTLNPNESAFVCIEPGSENISAVDGAYAIQIGCCCECESYRITGDTTYGTTLYGVQICGTNTIGQIDLDPEQVFEFCGQGELSFFALVNNPGPLYIAPMVESLGCCSVEP
jgi:hypothetical protein